MDLRLALIPNADGLPPSFDLVVENGDLALDDGLESALILSLFTDRRAGDDDLLPEPGGSRRGWWGDSYAPITGDRIGSRVWLLERERDLDDVYKRAKIYLDEACEWLVADGVAGRVETSAARLRAGVMSYTVSVQHGQAAPRQYQFLNFWSFGNAV
jgi:phage gp46-like protein